MMNYPYRPGTNPYGYPVVPQTNVGTPVGMQTGAFQQGAVPPQVPFGIPVAQPGMLGAGQLPKPGINPPGQLPAEESYIENILRLNLGKTATIYMTFENNREWNAKVFKGKLEAAGRDHIVISDPQTGMRYLLLMVNLDYITFDEPLQYYYPFARQTVPATR